MTNTLTPFALTPDPESLQIANPDTAEQESVVGSLRQLIAAARGTRTLSADDVASVAKELALGPSNSHKHRTLAQAAVEGTTLIPWYRADLVRDSHRAGLVPEATSTQLRPLVPRQDPVTGKRMTSFTLTGSGSAVDVHPATPAEWVTETERVLVFDDVAAADAALANLLSSALTTAEVSPILDGYRAAHDALHALMKTVLPDKRTILLTLAGDFANGDTWDNLRTKAWDVCLMLSTDPASDWAEWTRTKTRLQFFSAQTAKVAIVAPEPAGNVPGLDNAGGDVWDAAVARAVSELGPPPAQDRDNMPLGTWLVSEDGFRVDALEQSTAAVLGGYTRPQWVTKTPYGARVTMVRKHRSPTDEELASGAFGAGVSEETPGRSTCEIEVRWVHDDETVRSAKIIGPVTILQTEPKNWDKLGAVIPNEVLLLPMWPPVDGWDWLRAVKGNRTVEPDLAVSWTSMGWVPTQNEPVCSFISGRTILSLTPDGAKSTKAGVTEAVLPGATKFSLPHVSTVDRGEWVAATRQDLRKLRTQFMERSPWLDEGIAAVVIAAGLRPTVPLRTTTVIYVQGPSGAGKSWTVSIVMSFHQDGATWSEKELPGSFADTSTSIELAVSSTIIWVLDDLAPSVSAQQNDAMQTKAGLAIRNSHNNTAKRRSGSDLKAREVHEPRALLLVTAENPHDIGSVRQRSVILELDSRSLGTGFRDEMTWFRDESGVPARTTAACVHAIQLLASEIGWVGMRERFESLRVEYRDLARAVLNEADINGTASTRAVDNCVDLMMGFAALHVLAEQVDDAETLQLVAPGNPDGLPSRLAKYVGKTSGGGAEDQSGATLLTAIRSLCAAGKAHILNGYDPSEPPCENSSTLRALGWQSNADGVPLPLGQAIGVLRGVSKDSAWDIVWLEQQNAFDATQRAYPKVLPYGTAPRSAFGALWDEDLIHPHYLAKGRDRGKVVKAYFVNGRSQTGIPVHLDRLLGETTADEAE